VYRVDLHGKVYRKVVEKYDREEHPSMLVQLRQHDGSEPHQR